MTSQTERLIHALESVADGYFVETLSSSKRIHNAETITRLVQTSCLAVMEPNSPEVRQFIERCNHFSLCDFKTMDPADVKGALEELFIRLDELFFFGILSRHAPLDDSNARRRFIELDVVAKQEPQNSPGMHYPGTNKIVIHLTRSTERMGFDLLLPVLSHELVHAWFDLADKRPFKHTEWVDQHDGHGTMFVNLNKFIYQYLGDMVPELKPQLSRLLRRYTDNLKTEDDRPRGWWKCW